MYIQLSQSSGDVMYVKNQEYLNLDKFKELCHDDFVVLGQFFAKIVT